MRKELSSNTTPARRLARVLDFGLKQIQNASSSKFIADAVGITYYLLGDGRIVTFREWYQMNRPNYVVSGTKKGCESHLLNN